MLYWETVQTVPGQPPVVREFAGIWQAANKIVFSRTLASAPIARTRIERSFDPGMVRQLKSATAHDMTVGGADLARQASRPGWSTSCSCSWFGTPQRRVLGPGTTGHAAVRKRRFYLRYRTRQA